MSAKQEYIDSVDGCAHQSAVEIIERLVAENKVLIESKLTCADCGRTFDYINKVEQIRDELLGALEDMFELGFDDHCEPPFVTKARSVIKKAETLKDANLNSR